MPRTKKPEREGKRLKRRNRKFIRKDTQQEYKLRTGMVLVNDRDGMQTYFKPSDLASYEPEPKPEAAKCSHCGDLTIRTGMTIEGDVVPMCVECGIDHNHRPKEEPIIFGQRRP